LIKLIIINIYKMQRLIILVLLSNVLAQIHIKDVQVLTLYANEYTTGRRNAPIAQLKCIGSACYQGALQTMQCTNKGFDGMDANWECKSDIDNRYTLGRVTVSCEGYNNPNDPHILVGSCGAEYELNFNTKTATPNTPNRDITVTTWWDPMTGSYYNTYSRHDGAEVILLFIFLIIIFLMCCISAAQHHTMVTPGPPPPPTYYDSWGPSWGPSWGSSWSRPSYWSRPWYSPVPVAQTTFSSAPSSFSSSSTPSGTHIETRGARTTRR
jgi:SOCE-associated regulatory factor of calcium homoeostasis